MNVVELLKDDHRVVETRFEQYEEHPRRADAPAILRQIADGLTLHTEVEEEILYPPAAEHHAEGRGRRAVSGARGRSRRRNARADGRTKKKKKENAGSEPSPRRESKQRKSPRASSPERSHVRSSSAAAGAVDRKTPRVARGKQAEASRGVPLPTRPCKSQYAAFAEDVRSACRLAARLPGFTSSGRRYTGCVLSRRRICRSRSLRRPSGMNVPMPARTLAMRRRRKISGASEWKGIAVIGALSPKAER
jgi:hypothetical protein